MVTVGQWPKGILGRRAVAMSCRRGRWPGSTAAKMHKGLVADQATISPVGFARTQTSSGRPS